MTFIGDTQYIDFSQLDYIAKSKILITECTFYEEDHKERAEAGKHIHIEEFVKLLENMQNEHIIIVHTTQRTGMKEINKILKKAVPQDIYKKITLLMTQRLKQNK